MQKDMAKRLFELALKGNLTPQEKSELDFLKNEAVLEMTRVANSKEGKAFSQKVIDEGIVRDQIKADLQKKNNN